jgi:acetyl esterase
VPEHKFPAAWDDALAACKWALAKAASVGGDPKRVALAGESAGGNLALATAIAARDAKLQAPAHVLAVYLVTQTSLNTESYLENAIAKPLTRAMVKWFVDHLVNGPADLKDPRLQLIDADLAGLAPVTLINARIDPLHSDGAKMESALKTAKVPVERRDYIGMTHEFFGAAAVVQKAAQAQACAGQRLKQAFGSQAGRRRRGSSRRAAAADPAHAAYTVAGDSAALGGHAPRPRKENRKNLAEMRTTTARVAGLCPPRPVDLA